MDRDIIDFKQIRKDLNHDRYEYIGSGSSRSVYDLENGYVVKAALNYGGLSQNRLEHKIYMQEQAPLFAPILTISEDAMFLIMKKGERLSDLNQVLEYYQVSTMQQLIREDYFIKIRETYRLASGDLRRKSSWGMIDEVPVLVDYGYTGSRKCRR
ncbi:hypothetical protein [Anaerosporobacter sp.]|uniref:hypothetical protein n=1 Tax=Anaerosporobacter sp. TaxID=1872529 RepID=UPI00286F44EB|nr:hypothetical protein [Anaerosporobacter sp.]